MNSEGLAEVTSLETSVDDPNDNFNPDYLKWEKRKKSLQDVVKMIATKLEALAWVSAAAFSIWIFLYSAIFCVAVHAGLAVYSSIILPYLLRVRDSFENYNPKAAYFGVIMTFFGFMTTGIAIWPIWGFWSFPLLAVIGMGYLMIGHFLPNSQLGSVIVGLLVISGFVLFEILNHESFCDQHEKIL